MKRPYGAPLCIFSTGVTRMPPAGVHRARELRVPVGEVVAASCSFGFVGIAAEEREVRDRRSPKRVVEVECGRTPRSTCRSTTPASTSGCRSACWPRTRGSCTCPRSPECSCVTLLEPRAGVVEVERPAIGAPSSPLPRTPSGPGSSDVTGTLYASSGRRRVDLLPAVVVLLPDVADAQRRGRSAARARRRTTPRRCTRSSCSDRSPRSAAPPKRVDERRLARPPGRSRSLLQVVPVLVRVLVARCSG